MTKNTKILAVTIIIAVIAGLVTYLSGGDLLGRIMKFKPRIPTVYKMEEDKSSTAEPIPSEVEYGEVSGYNDSSFGPDDDDAITKEEYSEMTNLNDSENLKNDSKPNIPEVNQNLERGSTTPNVDSINLEEKIEQEDSDGSSGLNEAAGAKMTVEPVEAELPGDEGEGEGEGEDEDED